MNDSKQAAKSDLWRLWDALRRLFPVWSFIPSSIVTPGAWGYAGVDFLSGFRRNPSTIRAFALLEQVDDVTFDALTALASLNARRQDQMMRAVILGYLTVPLSILALLAELNGAGLLAYGRAHIDTLVALGAGAALAPLMYMMSHWRSRQMIGVLDLIRIERGQAPYTALELREE